MRIRDVIASDLSDDVRKQIARINEIERSHFHKRLTDERNTESDNLVLDRVAKDLCKIADRMKEYATRCERTGE